MNKLHKVLHLLMALVLVGFALPGIAQTKYFSTTAPAVVPNGTTTDVRFTFSNATPKPGVSTINSVLITPPPNVTIICTTIKLLGAPKPGTGAPYNDGLNSCVVNGFTGIPNQTSGTFSFTTIIDPPKTCAAGIWGSAANTGNTFPQGTAFSVSPGGTSTPSSGVGCTGSVACGGSFLASANGAGPGDPGYVNVEVSNNFKNGLSCSGTTFFFNTANRLLIDNKLIITLSDPNAAFTATVFSDKFPLDGTPYASRRLRVAWEFDGNGNPIATINAPTCSCSAASLACMPIDHAGDYYDGQRVRVCVTDYTWMLDGTDVSGNPLVRYQAIVNAINDPQFGFE